MALAQAVKGLLEQAQVRDTSQQAGQKSLCALWSRELRYIDTNSVTVVVLRDREAAASAGVSPAIPSLILTRHGLKQAAGPGPGSVWVYLPSWQVISKNCPVPGSALSRLLLPLPTEPL